MAVLSRSKSLSAWSTAAHDWRELQRVKNQIAGEQWEAFELYPSETRLIDPSNYFILLAFPNLAGLGLPGPRQIRDYKNCIAPQRALAKGDEPPELTK